MRSKSVEITNTFNKGLLTESSSLNFPKDACTETYNCRFDEHGKVTRRLGLDYEGSHSTFVSTRDDDAISEFVWTAPNGDGTVTFIVVQIGATLYFYTEDLDGPLSPGKQSFTVLLTDFDVAGAPTVDTEPCQYSSGKGYLFVTHPYCDPFYVTYVPGGPSASGTVITIQTRDLVGLTPTGTYPDNITRPTSTRAALDDFDEYNLLNAGWGVTAREVGDTAVVALNEWDTDQTTMPALGDVWWSWLDANNELNTVGTLVDTVPPTNARAPMGTYILNEFLQERDVPSGLSGLSNDDVTSSYFRPKTTAFFAGRVWYAGVDYTGYNGSIYFSQIIETNRQFGYCYQVNDPTDKDIADLLPSDGGVVRILDIANIVKLFVMGPILLVFATNGIWAISGSQSGGLGFTANDYTVTKISAIYATSGSSFVDVEGAPVWWNYEGIWTITSGQTGIPQVTSLTESTIDTFYRTIPTLMKNYVKGAYNRQKRVIQWIYRSTTTADVDVRYNYDRILNLNVETGAFYPWSIDTTVGVLINGIVSCRGTSDDQGQENVTDSAVNVTDASSEIVTTLAATSEVAASIFHYLTTKNTSGTSFTTTFSKERDTTFVDWETAGTGVSYSSYWITGYELTGQAQRFFQNNYVFFYLETQNDASLHVQNIWDFASSASGGRYSDPHQVYKSRPFQNIQQSRVKLRGKGRAMQFKGYSTAGKPFSLHGWSRWTTQAGDP